MIQANSLRLGNYVYYSDNELVNILMIDKSLLRVAIGIDQEHGDFLCSYDKVSGIPITEELLLKMGFVRLNFGWIIDNGSRNEHGDIIHGDETFGLFDHSFGKLTNLKYNQYPVAYVHQLMNLYHALTGQELTLS